MEKKDNVMENQEDINIMDLINSTGANRALIKSKNEQAEDYSAKMDLSNEQIKQMKNIYMKIIIKNKEIEKIDSLIKEKQKEMESLIKEDEKRMETLAKKYKETEEKIESLIKETQKQIESLIKENKETKKK